MKTKKIINKALTKRYIFGFYIFLIVILSVNLSFSQDNNANIKITYHQMNDSSKSLSALVTNPDGTPVSNVEVHFYVKRMFGLLPIESTMGNIPTDEKGETSIDLPIKDYPGDSLGNLVIIAKIEGSELYPNVMVQNVMKIGKPLKKDLKFYERRMWAPNAPLPLILTFVLLIGGVWYAFSFVVFQISRIKKNSV